MAMKVVDVHWKFGVTASTSEKSMVWLICACICRCTATARSSSCSVAWRSCCVRRKSSSDSSLALRHASCRTFACAPGNMGNSSDPTKKCPHEAIRYYFENTGWPELREMDQAFQEDCEDVGISEVAYKKTVGFAPAWVFILDIISNANVIERKWFDICLDHFFEDGNFPDLNSMPGELQKACDKLDISEFEYYVPDM